MRTTDIDSMTHEDLIACIDNLEKETREMEATIEGQKQRLTEAADLMAELGRIHNTPHAKAEWLAGR